MSETLVSDGDWLLPTDGAVEQPEKDHRTTQKGSLDGCSLKAIQAHADAASVSTGVNNATSEAARGEAQRSGTGARSG